MATLSITGLGYLWPRRNSRHKALTKIGNCVDSCNRLKLNPPQELVRNKLLIKISNSTKADPLYNRVGPLRAQPVLISETTPLSGSVKLCHL